MRVQCYDGAANMSGKYNGVQARLLQTVPGAMYVHCKSHCLNVAIVYSCNDVSVGNVMSTVQLYYYVRVSLFCKEITGFLT